jgi:Xaa-Pro aminopeptidase
LDVSEGALFPERAIKSEREQAAVAEGNRASAAGIRAVEQVLRRAAIKSGYLYFEGRKLTSERLRREADVACLYRGAVAAHTIVAGGDQACDPHCSGKGPLRANELIIVDVFPRVTATGYFGDMTRTFLKGRASTAQRRLVAAVREAQRMAIGSIKAGLNGSTVHRKVEEFFAREGFPTGKREKGHEGFFHGTGHGLGLEIHEYPRLGRTGGRLRAGMVTTVEPGLYYRGLGGCRIEDVVAVTGRGSEMLSRCHYRWEIR